jgi:hypothetical protein
MSARDSNTRHSGIPRLGLEDESCRLGLVLKGRFDNIWKVDCHE